MALMQDQGGSVQKQEDIQSLLSALVSSFPLALLCLTQSLSLQVGISPLTHSNGRSCQAWIPFRRFNQSEILGTHLASLNN